MSIYDMTAIARMGGSLILSALEVSPFDLTTIARVLVTSPGVSQMVIKDSANLTSGDMIAIARIGKGRVTFDFT